MRKPKQLLRLFLFVGLSAFSIGLILYLTSNRQTLRALSGINPYYLMAMGLLWLFSLGADSISVLLFICGVDERISFWESLKTVFIRIFFNLITPFTAGGQAVIVYTLSKNGIPPGKSSSVVVTKLMSVAFFGQLGGITAFIIFHQQITTITAINTAILVTALFFLAVLGIVIFFFIKPSILIPLATLLIRLLHRLKLVKDIRKIRHKMFGEIRLARTSLKRYFSHHFGFFAGAVINCLLQYCAEVTLLWVVLRAFGIELPFLEGAALSALIIMLLGLMPTPGNAGLGEVVFIVILAGTMPKYLLGISVLVWRLFYRYLSGIIGALISAQTFSRLLVNEDEPQ